MCIMIHETGDGRHQCNFLVIVFSTVSRRCCCRQGNDSGEDFYMLQRSTQRLSLRSAIIPPGQAPILAERLETQAVARRPGQQQKLATAADVPRPRRHKRCCGLSDGKVERVACGFVYARRRACCPHPTPSSLIVERTELGGPRRAVETPHH